ncbi:MAG: hypothetical protein HQM09_14455 [Candidatus Riflebacteria bacterium]|nr:hypothetical protein [Candidatus Riflebacteria bacterium]
MLQVVVLVRDNHLRFFLKAGSGLFDSLPIKGESSWDLGQPDPLSHIARAIEYINFNVSSDCNFFVLWWDGQATLWKNYVEEALINKEVLYFDLTNVIEIIASGLRLNDSIPALRFAIDNEYFEARWTLTNAGKTFFYHRLAEEKVRDTIEFRLGLEKAFSIICSGDDVQKTLEFCKHSPCAHLPSASPTITDRPSGNETAPLTPPPSATCRFRIEASNTQSRSPQSIAGVVMSPHRTVMVGRASRTQGTPDIDLEALFDDPVSARCFSRREMEFFLKDGKVIAKHTGKQPPLLQRKSGTSQLPMREVEYLEPGDRIILQDKVIITISESSQE